DWSSNASLNLVALVARLRDGVAPVAAGDGLRRALLASRRGRGTDRLTAGTPETPVPGSEARRAAQARIALWLSGVSMVVLLLAIGNVGTMLLLRATRRRRELAVRIALGAGRVRLARQSLVESLALAALGCGVALLLAAWVGALI